MACSGSKLSQSQVCRASQSRSNQFLTWCHIKTKQLTEVLELASTLSAKGISRPGLGMGTDALPQLSPKPHALLLLPFSTLKLLYTSTIVRQDKRVKQEGEVQMSLVYESFLEQYLEYVIFSMICNYHINKNLHILPFRYFKPFQFQFRCQFFQESWL